MWYKTAEGKLFVLHIKKDWYTHGDQLKWCSGNPDLCGSKKYCISGLNTVDSNKKNVKKSKNFSPHMKLLSFLTK